MVHEGIFGAGTVVRDLESTEKFSAIKELIQRAPVFGELGNHSDLEAAVIAREKLQSTGFGHGVAVAHGRVSGIPRILASLGISRKGIPFNAPDGVPVQLLFLIASPPHMHIDYLQVLSALARTVRNESLRNELLTLGTAEAIEQRLRQNFSTCLAQASCRPAMA